MATFEEWWQSTNLGIHSTSESIGKSSWNAGAASRDAEVAELRELSPCGKHSIIHWARPMRAEPFCTVCAEIAELRAQLERATDLVRYARHFLHEEELISDDEYAAIVQDNEDGKRVARLEGYDRAAGAASRDEEVAALKNDILEMATAAADGPTLTEAFQSGRNSLLDELAELRAPGPCGKHLRIFWQPVFRCGCVGEHRSDFPTHCPDIEHYSLYAKVVWQGEGR